jgi:hypothetical protein
MCFGCYLEAGSPAPNDEAKAIGIRLRDVDAFGGCHIVVSDWNLEDDNIDFCIDYPTTTDAEREIMRALKVLPDDQRYAAMAVADHYI